MWLAYSTLGIHTVEGNVAGERAARLAKEREKEQQQYEAVKNKIKEQNSAKLGKIDDKFNTSTYEYIFILFS
jgi:protein FAM50